MPGLACGRANRHRHTDTLIAILRCPVITAATCSCLLLVGGDSVDGGQNARLVELREHPHGDDAALVAEDGPAEMRQMIEDREADDANDEVDGPGGHH